MPTTTITLSNTKVELTVEQLIAALRQLESEEREKILRALAETELDAELGQLVADLYAKPPVTDVSEQDILNEVRSVRAQQS